MVQFGGTGSARLSYTVPEAVAGVIKLPATFFREALNRLVFFAMPYSRYLRLTNIGHSLSSASKQALCIAALLYRKTCLF